MKVKKKSEQKKSKSNKKMFVKFDSKAKYFQARD